ncbi:phage holin family protein [Bacillus testis]|uniref:phage holin family protein n=1 Tax=Bacillus testis TaxID=1622072 RepID=UPI00067F322F|nr:phage holin family protein [Bacillus testis]
MEEGALLIQASNLEIVQAYLFGNVKYLDLLVIAVICDIFTGVLVAIKEKRLRSRTAFYGYARKLGIFIIIILANIIDKIMGLNGSIAFVTVLFYIANEGLSILENLAIVGLKIPSVITEKLHVIESEPDKKEEK